MPDFYGRLHDLDLKAASVFRTWRLYFLTLSAIKIGKGCKD